MIQFIKDNLEIITLLIALLGAVLGIINTFGNIAKSKRDKRMKVEVTPKLGKFAHRSLVSSSVNAPDASSFLVVEVVNKSFFPVYINGLYLKSSTSAKGVIAQIDPEATQPDKKLPCKLDRNESVTLYAIDTTIALLRQNHIVGAYVKTACGREFSGSSRAMQSIQAKA